MQRKFQISDTVLLRTLTLSDAPALFRSVEDNREYLRQWMPWLDETVRVEDATQFIVKNLNRQSDETGFQCGIFRNEELVGMCGYHPIDRSNNSVAIEWVLSQAKSGDAVLISGCGERPFALVGEHHWTIADREVCQAWLYDNASMIQENCEKPPGIYNIDDYRS